MATPPKRRGLFCFRWGIRSFRGLLRFGLLDDTLLLGRLRLCGRISSLITVIAQLPNDCGYVVFLEEADGGYAGCSGLQAGAGVLQSHSS
jgi:hypothetical protein